MGGGSAGCFFDLIPKRALSDRFVEVFLSLCRGSVGLGGFGLGHLRGERADMAETLRSDEVNKDYRGTESSHQAQRPDSET